MTCKAQDGSAVHKGVKLREGEHLEGAPDTEMTLCDTSSFAPERGISIYPKALLTKESHTSLPTSYYC